MAPISEIMQGRYDLAVQSFLEFLEGFTPFENLELNTISELKGMFNRCVRQDQWDWFSVYSEFGNPPFESMRRITGLLTELRNFLKNKNYTECYLIKQRLVKENILHYLKTYEEDINLKYPELEGGWIYILSTREYPNILKIGVTERSVNTRVKEINSVTGVVFPYSVRKIIRVYNAKHVEKMIHKELDEYRIRRDREFFHIEFSNAICLIDSIIKKEKLRSRHKGLILWFDEELTYGFADAKLKENVFIHKSQVTNKKEISLLNTGVKVEFDLARNLKGYLGIDVRIIDE